MPQLTERIEFNALSCRALQIFFCLSLDPQDIKQPNCCFAINGNIGNIFISEKTSNDENWLG